MAPPIGKRIAQARKAAGWTQAQLSQHTHFSVQLVSAVEQGRKPASHAFTTIAVGTALASGPPRRSQRALLTHWAPASGSGVEAHVGEGMPHAGGW